MDFRSVILVLGFLWIVGVILWSWNHWELEPFTMEWVRTPLDTKARQGQSCGILDSFPDELSGVIIALVDTTCEEGMPHTSDADTIRIPATLWNSASAVRRANILRHERIHILQRRDPIAWTRFYRNEWNYTLHKTLPVGMDPALVRGNPDTDPPFACWNQRYWFVPLYTDTDSPRLSQTQVRVWDSQTEDWCEPPLEWRATFCDEGRCPHQWEHPAELAAEYEADDWVTPASVRLRNFILSMK